MFAGAGTRRVLIANPRAAPGGLGKSSSSGCRATGAASRATDDYHAARRCCLRSNRLSIRDASAPLPGASHGGRMVNWIAGSPTVFAALGQPREGVYRYLRSMAGEARRAVVSAHFGSLAATDRR